MARPPRHRSRLHARMRASLLANRRGASGEPAVVLWRLAYGAINPARIAYRTMLAVSCTPSFSRIRLR